LLLKTGGIILGNNADATIVKGAMLSAETHNVPYEYLHGNEIKKDFLH